MQEILENELQIETFLVGFIIQSCHFYYYIGKEIKLPLSYANRIKYETIYLGYPCYLYYIFFFNEKLFINFYLEKLLFRGWAIRIISNNKW